MPDPAPVAKASEAAERRFLTFHVDGDLYGVPAELVAEIIRIPPVSRVPHSPPGLLGVANLRGVVLPLASLRGLLGRSEEVAKPGSRAIVLTGAAAVAITVDAVEALVSVAADQVETRQAELAQQPGERLLGAFRTGDGAAKILDLRGLLDEAFIQTARPPRAFVPSAPGWIVANGAAEANGRQKLVTFDVAGQEFALDLAAVREIVRAPDSVAIVPRAEAVVVGVMAYRDTLLPLMSLRGLLGLAVGGDDQDRRKVVVTTVAGVMVGLIVDHLRAILHVDPELLEATPLMLAARTGGETRIASIYRGEGGRRLISVLSPEQLFREDVMQRLSQTAQAPTPTAGATRSEEVKYLVFRLGEEEFGLPIGTVDEVARVPDQITRLPKTPKFLEGVVNLRGEVLPVIDQRRRFDMPRAPDARSRRLIVVRTERHRAGLIVDSVSEVLGAPADAVEPAPDIAGEANQLVHGVLNLDESGRMILLLDPAELLTRAERGLLEAFDLGAGQADQ